MSSAPANAFLRALEPQALARLSSQLSVVELALGDPVGKDGDIVEFVYFPLSALLSMTRSTLNGFAVETGVVGNEGAASVVAALGSGRHSSRLQTQIGGEALRITASAFRQAVSESSSIGQAAWSAVEFQMWEAEQSCVCLAAHSAEARLARWLLDAAERSGRLGRDLAITHEFLGVMLGVQRTTVTRILGHLADREMIQTRRGIVAVTDTDRLARVSCECRHEGVLERRRLGLEAF